MGANQGKIEGLRLSNFTCFADLEVSFSEGINVIIGENGLGKTHLLKVLFNTAQYKGNKSFTSKAPEGLLTKLTGEERVISIFKGDIEDGKYFNMDFLNSFGIEDKNQLKRSKQKDWVINLKKEDSNRDEVFIPVSEMLSWYKGFIPAYENRESSIDYVYYLLAKKLAPLPLKGEKLKEQKLLIQELESELGFEVVRQGDDFFIAFVQGQVHNTKLVANGINKLAQVIYLIMNGSLTKNSILFWDEPEAGLNPKYVLLVVKFLQTLAKAGCQIFVSTHDYLLSYAMSLAAEYRDLNPDTPPIRFFSLYKSSKGTQIESADTLPEIQHNSILDQYSEFYQAEEDMFYQSMKVKDEI